MDPPLSLFEVFGVAIVMNCRQLGDDALRDVERRAHAEVETGDEGVLADVDRREDLETLRDRR